MKVITVAGPIGSGKTSLTTIIAEHLGFEPMYEEIANLPMLEEFYLASEEEQERKRYPFLLQLEFLNNRFYKMKHALRTKDVVMDRSIYEDLHFASVLNDRGEISDTEFRIYSELFDNMMYELEELPKKAPDLLIYIKISFEKEMERIGMRGRDFEQDENLREYYYQLWEAYDHWVYEVYDKSEVLTIDADKYDFLHNETDRLEVVSAIETAYNELEEDFNKSPSQ